jgi:hypothetical protein
MLSDRVARLRRSPFGVLWREFFDQFFTSEAVSSDVQLRQTIIWVLAFLITPGFMMVIYVMPMYELTALVARARNMPWLVDEILQLMGGILVTYSMVTTGFIAVFVWDALAFERRDAMVLGPLPVASATIVSAKLAALATLLFGASAAVNLITAVPFALVTANHDSLYVLVRNFVTFLLSTVGAATFTFASIVAVRGAASLAGGARFTALVGSVMQFLFVTALLCMVMLVPAVSPARARLLIADQFAWVPPAWFLGLFERGLGIAQPEFAQHAARALVATPLTVLLAVAVAIAGFRRQAQLALTPSASAGPLGSARMPRLMARLLVGRDRAARATAEFILLTLARNRAQQAYVAMNAAVGVAIVAAGLSRGLSDPSSLLQPRTIILWIPLILAYWITIGLRASFFMPSELPASWSFQTNAPFPSRAYWSAVRAAMLAWVVPPTVVACTLLTPLVGWNVVKWHLLLSCLLATACVQVVALTVRHVPYTRPYQPGHAKLKTRWPVYLIGMYALAYWPVQIELRLLRRPETLPEYVVWLIVAIGCLEIAGWGLARRCSPIPPEQTEEELEAPTVLNIGAAPGVGAIR